MSYCVWRRNHSITYIFETKYPFEMVFKTKCSLLSTQIGILENINFNFAAMWPIPFDHVTIILAL